MPFKQLLNSFFIAAFFIFIFSCGIDERGERKRQEEKTKEMDSLFKDANIIPLIEGEEADSVTTP